MDFGIDGLGHVLLALATLRAALEEVQAPAFVVARGGRVLHQNAAGRALLARDGSAVRLALARSGGPPDATFFEVTRLAVDGHDEHFLCVRRMPREDALAHAAYVARRWALTPRQTAVLARMASGDTNSQIASELACAESTVEQHVAALLEKSRCGGRTQLVARFWTE